MTSQTTAASSSKGQTKANLTTDLGNHGIILHKHSTITELYSLSGPNAKSNEFQMHCWMLVFRHKFPDASYLDIAVPTCYFNYEQFVTSAHVDFEMKDVSELSAKLQPVHNMVVSQILATTFTDDLENLFGFKFDLLSVDVGTLHRHPGGSARQAFSGTDLDANNTHHGIVFPLKSGVEKPSFSGILAVDSGICNVAHYEYRLVNGSYETNDMEYVKGRCVALTLNDTQVAPKLSLLEQAFGATVPALENKTRSNNSLISPQLEEQLTLLINKLPSPNLQLVRSENVKVRPVSIVTYNTRIGATTVPHKFKLDTYDYPIYTLRYNYDAHVAYHGLPKDTAVYNKKEMEAKLLWIYDYKAPAKEFTFANCPIIPKTPEQLLALTILELHAHHDELEAYYYGQTSIPLSETEPDITPKEIIDYIQELYVNIVDEEKYKENPWGGLFDSDYIG